VIPGESEDGAVSTALAPPGKPLKRFEVISRRFACGVRPIRYSEFGPLSDFANSDFGFEEAWIAAPSQAPASRNN
jgi:hypothetical protein